MKSTCKGQDQPTIRLKMWRGIFIIFCLSVSKEKLTNAKEYGVDICILCKCSTDIFSGKQIDCSRRNLTEMPAFRPGYTNRSISGYVLRSNWITNVSKEYLKQFPNLEDLDLTNNKISFIPEDLLKNTINLRNLVLRNNKISVIPVDVFKNNPKLFRIFLSNNAISVIPTDAFKNNPKLELLVLSNNNITVIPMDVFKHTPNLRSLSLDGNPISAIPVEVFKDTPNLLYLSTSGLIDCCNAYRMTFGRLWQCNNKPPPYNDCGVKLLPIINTPGKRISVGRVEVYKNGYWTNLCEQNWTKADADVTCRDLGFSEAIESLRLPPNFKGNKTTFLKTYRCTGHEGYLIECPSRVQLTTSACSNVAGVRCKDEGKRLCNVCGCTSSFVDCTGRRLEYVPWENNRSIGANVAKFDISDNNLKTIWRGLLDTFPALQYLDFSRNKISEVEEDLLEFSRNLTNLTMAQNRIVKIPPKLFDGLFQLKHIDFSFNSIKYISENLFKSLRNLEYLDLSSNKLDNLPKLLFNASDNRLEYLFLQKNSLKTIYPNTMKSLKKLRTLELSNNRLEKLPHHLFPDDNRLEYLSIRKNDLRNLEPKSMENLVKLKTLDISENPGLYIENWKFLLKMENLKELRTTLFSQCCFVKKESPDVKCIAPEDYFSDCDRMIKSQKLRYIVWIILVFALGGNAIALVLRVVYRTTFNVQNILILNLSFADFLTGLYLVVIVNRDLVWHKDYYLYDHEWRSSVSCKGFGALALISREVCVLTLAVITYNQRKTILYGSQSTSIMRGWYKFIIFLIWLTSIAIAVVPAVVKPYFYNEEKAEGYYGTNGLCLPLQLPGEKDTAWEYCLVLFGVLNFAAAIFMAWAYCTIFYASYVTTTAYNNVESMKQQPRMTIRFAVIVFTDILCWFSIAILLYISLAGIVSNTENDLYAWFSICVVTINSAINPVIHTITSSFYCRKIKGWFQCRKCLCCTRRNDDENQANAEPEGFETEEWGTIVTSGNDGENQDKPSPEGFENDESGTITASGNDGENQDKPSPEGFEKDESGTITASDQSKVANEADPLLLNILLQETNALGKTGDLNGEHETKL